MGQNFTSVDSLMKNKNAVYGGSATGSKEALPPMIDEKKQFEIQEQKEHMVEKDVEQFVTPRSETIELPPDIEKLGAQATNPTQFPTYQNIKLPISDDKILSGLHAPITSSLRWLATFAQYILACAHIALKKVHGKVVRVIKTAS